MIFYTFIVLEILDNCMANLVHLRKKRRRKKIVYDVTLYMNFPMLNLFFLVSCHSETEIRNKLISFFNRVSTLFYIKTNYMKYVKTSWTYSNESEISADFNHNLLEKR